MRLNLPYPPSNNRYYRHGPRGVYLSKEGQAYRLEVLAARPREGWPMKGRLAVQIEYAPKVGNGLDVDNVPKGILDSLQAAKIFENDSQIDELTVRRLKKVGKGEKPYCTVEIKHFWWME